MEEIKIMAYCFGCFIGGVLITHMAWDSFFEGYLERKQEHINQYKKALKIYKDYNDFLKSNK